MIFNYKKYFIDRADNEPVSDNDICRIITMFVQDGKCYVTKELLLPNERELHHRRPRQYGGEDLVENTVYILTIIHKMIHAKTESEYFKYFKQHPLTLEQVITVNQLRVEARVKPIEMTPKYLPYINQLNNSKEKSV